MANDFPLANKAKDLLKYTFTVTKPVSETPTGEYKKIGFPKSAIHTYVNTIRQAAISIVRNVQAANDCSGKTELEKRIDIISEIINDSSLILVLIDISHDLGYIDTHRLEYWGKLARDVKYISMSWKKKEGERLRKTP